MSFGKKSRPAAPAQDKPGDEATMKTVDRDEERPTRQPGRTRDQASLLGNTGGSETGGDDPLVGRKRIEPRRTAAMVR